MFRVLYHSSNRSGYSALREALPEGIGLQWLFDKKRLNETLVRTTPHALVLSFEKLSEDDLLTLEHVVGNPVAPAVLITASQITLPQAVCCIHQGAVDCLKEPISPQLLASRITRMALTRKSKELENTNSLMEGIGPAVQNLSRNIRQYAALPHPVLIHGETGSGKDLTAQTLHKMSACSNGPFVAINCASCPEALWESELFGSSRGAFTGSVDRPGCFEQAHGGTLFLDEIGELGQHGQASLLRVIEDKKIARLGSFKSKKVNIRVIAATNRNLRSQMKKQLFRPDLFYRLNLLALTVPPLRKRKEDIPKLSRAFLARASPEKPWKIDGGAIAKLVHYPWPGNIRELHSVLLRASLLTHDSTIRAKDIIFY